MFQTIWGKIRRFFVPDYNAKMRLALDNLLKDSKKIHDRYLEITKLTEWNIVVARLEGEIEAKTHLLIGANPWIEVDVSKVGMKHDRLEPVIGHEINHVWDAYFKYGLEDFCAIVAREANLPWDQRTVEKSAIQAENELRAQLLKDFPKEYGGMAPTRVRQNNRFRGFVLGSK